MKFNMRENRKEVAGGAPEIGVERSCLVSVTRLALQTGVFGKYIIRAAESEKT